MCPESSPAPKRYKQRSVASILQHDIPVYKENPSGCYIEFRAFDPELGRMHRKTIKLNRIKNSAQRKKHAREVIKRIVDQFNHGWNPWIAKDTSNLTILEEALGRYESHLEKMSASEYYRKETYSGYKSYLKILREYIAKKHPCHYTYQFDRRFCTDFLDYVFIDRDNGAQTRNNYLNFLRVLSGFLVEKGYLTSRPTDGIAPISKRLYKKNRECIPLEEVGRIAEYCKEREPDFLFACYLLYYCFIRPVEMTRLQVKHFNLKNQTLTLPGDITKNRMTQTVTLPKKVILYGIERGIFSAPMTDYIFSFHLRPGKSPIDPKHFRDHWEHVRMALNLKKEWKFYSLKDTGITEMLDGKLASIAVRDQARHSSLAITEIYTRQNGANAKANPDISDLDGAL